MLISFAFLLLETNMTSYQNFMLDLATVVIYKQQRLQNWQNISFSEAENPEEIKPPKARKVLIFTFNRKYDNYFHMQSMVRTKCKWLAIWQYRMIYIIHCFLFYFFFT